MISSEAVQNTDLLLLIPSVHALLRSETAERLAPLTGDGFLGNLVRWAADDVREEILKGTGKKWETREAIFEEMERRLESYFERERAMRQRRVINATGVIVHTNLGRAPLSDAAKQAVADAAGYCTLEYDLETGKRGARGGRAERLVAELAGAEDALIVNNCAAAAYFVLTVLASGGEAVISRGELVEIGGDFRVPDVLEQSGTVLREVGTTNRTKLKDYEKAINQNTRVILKVHPSNYRIVGFTATPPLIDLADLAHSKGLLLYEDAGSGALVYLGRKYGMSNEPLISQSIGWGADVVTFSGDKLLGGCQAGLIVGRKEVIDRLRKHPLYRVLRTDKLVYAALEATLEPYRRRAEMNEIPVLRMLSMTKEEIRERAEKLVSKLEGSGLRVEIVHGQSAVGGGAAPDVQPDTVLIALEKQGISADGLEESLRRSDPPVIARIEHDRVLIDLRTVSKNEEFELIQILTQKLSR